MAKKIIRSEFVEIIIPAGTTLTRFNFPDIPNLRNSHIWGLQLYTKTTLAKSILSQQDLIDYPDVIKGLYVTLVNYGGKEFLKQQPAQVFLSTFTGLPAGAIQPMEWDTKAFVGQKVNYPKSYIEFPQILATATDLAVCFSVYYSLPLKEEGAESGYSFGKRG